MQCYGMEGRELAGQCCHELGLTTLLLVGEPPLGLCAGEHEVLMAGSVGLPFSGGVPSVLPALLVGELLELAGGVLAVVLVGVATVVVTALLVVVAVVVVAVEAAVVVAAVVAVAVGAVVVVVELVLACSAVWDNRP